MRKNLDQRTFLKRLAMIAAAGVIIPKELFLGATKYSATNVIGGSGECSTSYDCSGGGGKCGSSYSCAGQGNNGNGKCGTSYDCSGGGGNCSTSYSCSGS